MAADTQVTVIGNLAADPELRFTPSGQAVTNFTVASTPRYFDRNTNEWKDGEALFLRCSLWREAAENAAESLTRGARVIVSGRLKQRSWTTAEGDTRSTVELDVDEVGPSLRFATATITRVNTGRFTRDTDRIATTHDRSDTEDPWTRTDAGGPAMAGAAAGISEEPPF